MIKFFRKIRQKNLSESKFGKYLLYAIGEIILVVIGILIALYINNTNEKRKEEEVEISYLKRFLIDLNKNETLWKDTYQLRKNQVQHIQNSIALSFNKQKDTLDYTHLAGNMRYALSWDQINPSQDTFSEMLSSGNLDIIKNDSIKIKLIALNNKYAAIINWDKTSENTHERLMEHIEKLYNAKDFAPLSPVFSEYVDIKFTKEDFENAINNLEESFSNMISNKMVLNNLDVLADNYHRQLDTFKELEYDVSELIDLIALEIKSRTDY
ncbi:DUF6090 family protein [Luteirhabdus pelagi]|uniref:DUF6090 family protein n=1 Tax=Luteirhabdus pelagi TaxID=2792783 RepID=UPI001939EA90|nr:DUF6090 family protein [Luteirhabdus pelagi]